MANAQPQTPIAKTSRSAVFAGLFVAAYIAIAWTLYYLGNHFQFVEAQSSDYVILAVIACGVPLAIAVRTARRSGRPIVGSVLSKTFAGSAILTAILAGVGLRVANGFLDFHPPSTFAATVVRVYCGRASSLTLRGAPLVPTPTDSMTIDLFAFDSCYGIHTGDTVFVAIKPGLFGRAWIAGRRLR